VNTKINPIPQAVKVPVQAGDATLSLGVRRLAATRPTTDSTTHRLMGLANHVKCLDGEGRPIAATPHQKVLPS